jgi:hypothetical protein
MAMLAPKNTGGSIFKRQADTGRRAMVFADTPGKTG